MGLDTTVDSDGCAKCHHGNAVGSLASRLSNHCHTRFSMQHYMHTNTSRMFCWQLRKTMKTVRAATAATEDARMGVAVADDGLSMNTSMSVFRGTWRPRWHIPYILCGIVLAHPRHAHHTHLETGSGSHGHPCRRRACRHNGSVLRSGVWGTGDALTDTRVPCTPCTSIKFQVPRPDTVLINSSAARGHLWPSSAPLRLIHQS